MAAPPVSPVQPQQIPEIKEAADLFQKGQLDECLKLLESTAKKHPELPPANVIMAQLFSLTNQPNNVRRALDVEVTTDPEDPEAYVHLGEFNMREGRVTEASLLFDKAAELLKTFNKSTERKKTLEPRTISGLASVAEARGNWPLAQKRWNRCWRSLPRTPARCSGWPALLFQQKKANDCLSKLRDAHKIDPKNMLTSEAILGQFYEQFGDHKNAVKWMGYALDAAPEDLATRLVVAQWALQTSYEPGQFDVAKKNAEKALQIDPKSPRAQMLRGDVALFMKEFGVAEDCFGNVVQQSPKNTDASNNLALALCEQNDDAKKDRALQYAEDNVRLTNRSAQSLSTYGWVLYRLGRKDAAEQALRAAAQAGPLNLDLAYYLAQVLSDRDHKDEAKSLLDAALKNHGPFSMRPEAQQLLDKLNKEPKAKEPKKESK